MADKKEQGWPHRKMPLQHSSNETRKANKPLMEKRRRARINSSLAQLKTLVLEAVKGDSNRYSKLEKADILEMTVKHLRTVQRQQLTEAMSVDQSVIFKFHAGFTECATEVSKYLNSTDGIHPEVRERLLGHLAGHVHKMSNNTGFPGNQAMYSGLQQQPGCYPGNDAAQQQRFPGNNQAAATYTGLSNNNQQQQQAARASMGPLQVQIPVSMLNQASPLPTPPPSAGHAPLHQVATQTLEMITMAQMAEILRGNSFPNNAHPNNKPLGRPAASHYASAQHVVTSRNSTSTPSPSEQSLSPPPLSHHYSPNRSHTFSPNPSHTYSPARGDRCVSVDSSLSAESASPMQGTYYRECSPMPGNPRPRNAAPGLQGPVDTVHSPQPYSRSHFLPVHPARSSQSQAFLASPQQRLGNQAAELHGNRLHVDNRPIQGAIDLSRPAEDEAKPAFDENHNDPERLPAEVTESMWRPW